MSIRQESGFFAGAGPMRPQICWRNWRPEEICAPPVALCHGLSEHSGTYQHVAGFLTERGIPVWALDHRGHGRSEGPRVYIEDFEHYVTDLGTLIDRATRAEGKAPFLIGHSMGGLIALVYALRRPTSVRGLVLSSPWLRTRMRIPLHLRMLVPVLARVTPRLQVANRGNDYSGLTRDPVMQASHAADPLRCRVYTPRWFHECLKAQRQVTRLAHRLSLPVLFLVAGSDPLVEPDAAATCCSVAGSQDKTFISYPERRHELFNDLGYADVLEALYNWLKDR